MNKIKLLQIGIVFLFLLNICLLLFIKIGKPHLEIGPRDILIKKLHFDNQQINDYDKLINRHRKEISEAQSELMTHKQALYKMLNYENENKDSMMNVIAIDQSQIEKIHYTHFEQIKKLCRKDQLKYFDEFTTEIATLFSPKPPPKHRDE